MLRMTLAIAALALQFAAAPARADGEDALKALAGFAAIAVIANEIKKSRDAREDAASANARAAAAEAKAEAALRGPAVCKNPTRDGSQWREANGALCLPTPAVCMREGTQRGRNYVYFESDCMFQEGFRLSQR